MIDSLRQLFVSRLLHRVARKPVRVKQLHQLPPQPAKLGGFLRREFLPLRHRLRRLRILPFIPRLRLPVFRVNFSRILLAQPHQRLQKLPPIAHTAAARRF